MQFLFGGGSNLAEDSNKIFFYAIANLQKIA